MGKFKSTTLRNKIHVKHGFSFKGEYFASEGKYILLTPGNFYESGGFKFDIEKAKFYNGKFPKEYICSKGDLVVAMTEQAEGLLGSSAIVPEDDRFLHNQRIGLVTVDENEIDKSYMYHVFNTKSVRQQLRSSSSGSKVKHTSPDRIYDVIVNLPPLPTQQKIAAVLSALDAKIELNGRINAELESMAKTLYDYWLVQFDFPNEKGKPYKSAGGKMVWNEELKREIPLGWEVKSLSEITKVSTDTINPMNFPQKEFKHYSIPAFDETGTYKIEFGEEIRSNKFTVEKSDILVSKLNPWFNRVVYATIDKDLICSSEFVVWRSENTSHKNYLYMIAKDTPFIDYCTRSASGTSHSHRRVNPQVMMRYQIPYNKEVATIFGTILGASIAMLAKNKVKSQTLRELRDWLLPMLMNGQVKVN